MHAAPFKGRSSLVLDRVEDPLLEDLLVAALAADAGLPAGRPIA